MQALDTFKKHYAGRWDHALIAKAWKDKGGKIVGYLEPNCPEELIMAAGCLPLLMTGDPKSGVPTVGGHMDAGASVVVSHLYEAILTGRYHFVDLICTTGGDRWMANTHGFLQEEKHNDPTLKFGESYYLERVRSSFRQHRDFNLARLREFKDYLEDFTGCKITDQGLQDAFAVTNETRRLLKQVVELRREDPPRLSGCDALQIISASMLMPKAEFNALLRQFLENEADALAELAGKFRLFVSGSVADNLQLYQLLESLPLVVVGEDTALGDRYSEQPISMEVEPMEALADRYTYKPLDPWMLGMNERINYRVESAVAAKAQGEIFFHLKNDDCVAWDYPDQKKRLESQGIPVLAFEDQEYVISNADDVKDRVKSFIAGVR